MTKANEIEKDRTATPLGGPETGQSAKFVAPEHDPTSNKTQRSPVTVAPNLTDLVAGRLETPEDQRAARQRRNLNDVVHGVLLFGLSVSTLLMLLGLALDLFRHRDVPTAVPGFVDVFRRVMELRPSGFLALGLLVLVATPILRVIGSVFAFLYERDWRFAGITFLVLVVVSLSLLLGHG